MKTLILIAAACFASVAFAQPSCAPTSTRCVGSGQEYTTIQAAADAAVAGDLVYVFNGTYTGFVVKASGSSGSPVTFQAQSPSVIINVGGNVNGDGINADSFDWIVIDGFTVTAVGRIGVRVVLSKHSVIKNCWIHHNTSNGILTGFAQYIQILNNHVEYNGTGSGQHNIYVGNSNTGFDGPVIRGNTVNNANTGNGLQFNGDCATRDTTGYSDGLISGWLVENNLFYSNASHDLMIIAASNGVARNNVMWGSVGAAVQTGSEAGCPQFPANNLIINNTMVTGTVSGIRVVQPATIAVVNNLIVTDDGRKCVDNETGGTCANGQNGVTYSPGTELGQTAAATGVFTNYAGHDYTLASGSPAINAGVSSFAGFVAPVVDFLNNIRPFGGGIDNGAYEFGSTSAGTDTTAPTTPGLPASVSTPYQVTLSWAASTDNREVLGYVLLRNGVEFDGTIGTSYVDNSVTPGTTYTYVVHAYDAAGNISANSATATVVVYGSTGCLNGDATWRTVPAPLERDVFEFTADVIPYGVSTTDAIFGISAAPSTAFGDNAILIAFTSAGVVTVRNGGTYTADVSFPYTVGTTYHVRVPVNILTHTYSVFISTTGGETALATNYAFRSEQASVTHLGYLNVIDDAVGSGALCAPSFDGQAIANLSFVSVQTIDLTTQAVSALVTDANGSGKPIFERPKTPPLTGSRSLALGDNAAMLVYSGSSGITVTIPTGLGAAFATTLLQDSTGTITISGAFSAAGATHTHGRGTIAVIQCTAADRCYLFGDVQ